MAVFSGPVTAAAVTANTAVGATAGGAELITADGRRRLIAGPLGPVRAVALSADGSTAATGHDRGAAFWDVRSGARRRLVPAQGQVSMVALAPGGRILVTGGRRGMLRVFGGVGAPRREIETGLGTVVAGAVSPDARYVGAGDSNGAAGVWEIATGKRVSRLTGHADAIAGMAFSSGSRLVGTASYDHDARIWRVADGRLLHLLPHGAVASGVAFGPDGRWVATAGPERAVIWDLGTGNQLLKLAGAATGDASSRWRSRPTAGPCTPSRTTETSAATAAWCAARSTRCARPRSCGCGVSAPLGKRHEPRLQEVVRR